MDVRARGYALCSRALLLLVVVLTSCKAFKGVEPTVLERVSNERHAIAETCSALQTADRGGSAAHSLSDTGKRLLRGDPRSTARTLAHMAARKAIEEANPTSLPPPPQDCRPPDIDAIYADPVRTFSTEQREQLEACSTYYFETLPEAIDQNAQGAALAWRKLAKAVENGGIEAKQALSDPATLSKLIDLSPHVTDGVARLAHLIHERVDSLTASIPYAGGFVGMAIELIGAELLAVAIDRVVYDLETRTTTQWVSRADVSRRACELIEQRTDQPTIVYRTLVRLILRFRYDNASVERYDFVHGITREGSYSAAAFCSRNESKRRQRLCRRIAKRVGVKLGGDENDSPRVGVKISDLAPRFAAVELAGSRATRAAVAGIDREYFSTEADARTKTMESVLERATASCSSVETCTLEAINRQLILFEGDEVNLHVHIHGGRQEAPCVRCCPSCVEPPAPPPITIVEPPRLDEVPFASPRTKIDLIVAIDRSVSMKQSVTEGDLENAVQNLRDRTHATLSIAQSDAVRFGPGCKVPSVVLAPKHDVWKEVEDFSTSPSKKGYGTPLVRTLARGVKKLSERRSKAAKLLVIVSDGHSTCLDRETTESLRAALDRAASDGIRVAFVRLPTQRADRSIDLGEHCDHSAMACISADGNIPRAIAQSLRGASCTIELPERGPKHASMIVDGEQYLRGWDYIDDNRTLVRLDESLCEAVDQAKGGTLRELPLPPVE